MTTKAKPPTRDAEPSVGTADGTVHPETRKPGKKAGVPDDSSSKAATKAQPDARTGHDKDGNAEQARHVAGGRRG